MINNIIIMPLWDGTKIHCSIENHLCWFTYLYNVTFRYLWLTTAYIVSSYCTWITILENLCFPKNTRLLAMVHPGTTHPGTYGIGLTIAARAPSAKGLASVMCHRMEFSISRALSKCFSVDASLSRVNGTRAHGLVVQWVSLSIRLDVESGTRNHANHYSCLVVPCLFLGILVSICVVLSFWSIFIPQLYHCFLLLNWRTRSLQLSPNTDIDPEFSIWDYNHVILHLTALCILYIRCTSWTQ